jgi:hypothetical protein
MQLIIHMLYKFFFKFEIENVMKNCIPKILKFNNLEVL